MTAVYGNVEDLYGDLKRCNDCCHGDYLSYHCPLCPIWKYKPRQLSKVKKHLDVHWKTRVQGQNGSFSVICHNHHDDVISRHYHCSCCRRIVSNKLNLIRHLKSCQGPSTCSIEVDHTDHHYSSENTSRYSLCKEERKDIGQKNKKQNSSNVMLNQHHAVIISSREGIYCAAVNRKGPAYPVHMLKRTTAVNTESFCEHMPCIELKDTAARGENLAWECSHIQSITTAVQGKIIELRPEILQEMADKKFITEARCAELTAWRNLETSSPLIVEIPSNSASASQRYIYLSVYTGGQRYWSRIGRTIVTIDKNKNTVSCKCSKSSRYCQHKAIGKWFVFQELQECVEYSSEPEENEENTDDTLSTDNIFQAKVRKSNMEIDLKYLQTKKIPDSLPRYTDLEWLNINGSKICPRENMCHICSCELKEEIISKRSKIVFMTRIVRVYVKVYIKMCPKCRTVYRYQEWVDGIHNFNNSLLIGLDVCSFLRAGIQNHVALGRSLSVLENMLKEKLNYMEIENAYLHFEALSDHGYDFKCVLCGYHSSILIWDTFRKARFRYAVSDLSMPSSEQVVSDTVDTKSFWSEIEESIILSGMNPGLSREVRLVQNYERWSPWIGPKSRIGIQNTKNVALEKLMK